MIWLDSRDGKISEAWVLSSFPGQAQVKYLETGDFLIFDQCGCSLGIERKTVNDFLKSLSDGRLDDQLTRLQAEYDYPMLLIQGTLRMNPEGKVSRRAAWHYAAAQMKLWSVQRRLGVAVLHCAAQADLIDTLRILHHRALNGCVSEGEEARRQRRKERAG